VNSSASASSISDSTSPLFIAVADEIARSIRDGQLAQGDRVPSVRILSAQRNVSLSTALAALRHLEAHGHIEARPQSGYYVRSQLSKLQPLTSTKTARRPRYVNVNGLFGKLVESMGDDSLVQLSSAIPEGSWFPAQALQRSLSSVVRRRPNLLVEYGPFFGVPSLKQGIARWYAEQGCAVSPDDIVITNGCIEALNLALRAVAKAGDVIAVEAPTYFGFLQIIESLGMRALEVATDPAGGMSAKALRAALDLKSVGVVKAVMLSPTVGNPMGNTIPESRQRELLALCEQRGITIIEDDVYGDLHYGATRPPPLKTWDANNIVTLCSSFSKSLAPGLRIGWMFGGISAERLRMGKYMTSISTAAALQEAIAELLTNRGYQRHLRGLRRKCEQQVAQFSRAVERYFPQGTRMSRPEGGFVLWLDLPGDIDTVELHEQALARKVSFAPGPLFSASGQFRSALRLNCGRELTPAVLKALKDLGSLAGA
jgi:DNA-binding transcriptional MocR family regulator